MRAVTYSEYGPPEVLRLADLPKPVPADDELLIRVRAVEATKSDCEMRSFHYPVQWFWLPMRIVMGVRKPKRPVLGFYFSGEVAAVGSSVTGFSTGDAVFGSSQLRLGAYAEYLTVPARYPIAKASGAVVTVVDRGDKEAGLRAFGADHFIDYRQNDFTRGSTRFDVIFDMVPGTSYPACQRLLNPGGRYLSGNPRLSTMLRTPITNRFTSRSASFAFAPETKQALIELAALIDAGTLDAVVIEIEDDRR